MGLLRLIPVIFMCCIVDALDEGRIAPYEIAALGKGYNIFSGNPVLGYSDPGLRVTRQIIRAGKTNVLDYSKRSYESIPYGVVYFRRRYCLKDKTKELISGTKSFHEALMNHILISNSDSNVEDFFAHSKAMSVMRKLTETDVVVLGDTSFCSLGEARFTGAGLKGVEKEFENEVLALDMKNTMDVKALVDKWGTHVITGLHFGAKSFYKSSSSRKAFISHVLQNPGMAKQVTKICLNKKVSSYMVFVDKKLLRAILNYDQMSYSFMKNLTSHEFVGSVGSVQYPEPIKLEFTPIDKIVSQVPDLSSISTNFTEAMDKYMHSNSGHHHKDENLVYHINWPTGRYALPMGKSGCPNGGKWETGWRMQDCPARYKNVWTDGAFENWPADNLNSFSINQTFCVKEDTSASDDNWPRGTYCIMRKGSCPSPFNESSLSWKDAEVNSRNSHAGTLPSGEYTKQSTEIGFCCRQDGDVNTPIVLPAQSSFYLFMKLGSGGCQNVFGMNVHLEEVGWGTNTAKYKFKAPSTNKQVIRRGRYTTFTVYNKELPEYSSVTSEDLQFKLRYCRYEPSKDNFCRSCSGCGFHHIWDVTSD